MSIPEEITGGHVYQLRLWAEKFKEKENESVPVLDYKTLIKYGIKVGRTNRIKALNDKNIRILSAAELPLPELPTEKSSTRFSDINMLTIRMWENIIMAHQDEEKRLSIYDGSIYETDIKGMIENQVPSDFDSMDLAGFNEKEGKKEITKAEFKELKKFAEDFHPAYTLTQRDFQTLKGKGNYKWSGDDVFGFAVVNEKVEIIDIKEHFHANKAEHQPVFRAVADQGTLAEGTRMIPR